MSFLRSDRLITVVSVLSKTNMVIVADIIALLTRWFTRKGKLVEESCTSLRLQFVWKWITGLKAGQGWLRDAELQWALCAGRLMSTICNIFIYKKKWMKEWKNGVFWKPELMWLGVKEDNAIIMGEKKALKKDDFKLVFFSNVLLSLNYIYIFLLLNKFEWKVA